MVLRICLLGRCYGPVMLPHLLSNFKLVWTSHPFLVGTAPNCTAKKYTTFLLEKQMTLSSHQ